MENILGKFTPQVIEKYGISTYDNLLCISLPNFIGINIENITEIKEDEKFFYIKTNSCSLVLWKTFTLTHLVVF